MFRSYIGVPQFDADTVITTVTLALWHRMPNLQNVRSAAAGYALICSVWWWEKMLETFESKQWTYIEFHGYNAKYYRFPFCYTVIHVHTLLINIVVIEEFYIKVESASIPYFFFDLSNSYFRTVLVSDNDNPA